jgi:hypothetical protein
MESVRWLSAHNPVIDGSRREVQVRDGTAPLYERCARLVSDWREHNYDGQHMRQRMSPLADVD